MRWAGWLFGLFVAAVACGGAPHDGSVDGGAGGLATPDGGAPDAGPPADCAGLLPAPPRTAFAFDVVPAGGAETCDASAIDGDGVVAAVARAARGTTWYEFAPDYGTASGNFAASGDVVVQPKGFIGLWGTAPVNVALFSQYGEVTPFPLGDGPAVLGPASGSGAISLAATSTALTVRKHDAGAAELAAATIAGPFVPRAAAEDASGAVLALTANGNEVSGVWVDLSKGSAGRPFPAGTGASVHARPLLAGGVAVQIDGRWAGVARPGETALRPAPAWLQGAADFAPALAGKAYALLPVSGGAVGIASAQGSLCGTVTFPGVSGISLGLDGTVVGASGARGCTKLVWRNAFR